MKEFNLSEKIFVNAELPTAFMHVGEILKPEDVKEFIKKLKDINIPIKCRIAMEEASEEKENESGDDILTFDEIENIVLKVYNREIEKLAGDELK